MLFMPGQTGRCVGERGVILKPLLSKVSGCTRVFETIFSHKEKLHCIEF